MVITDKDFLKELDKSKDKTIYVKITALNLKEQPVQSIEGHATGGSINVDGNSAVRRTCSLTMAVDQKNPVIDDVYWSFKNKFRLDIGVNNSINTNYSNIIWFKQGIFVINSFSKSIATNNMTINISGQDKGCLINGSINGSVPHEVNFAVLEEIQADGTVTTSKIPIYTIIKNALITYAQEDEGNIIINDLDEYGYELWEYRGDTPMYLILYEEQVVQMHLDGDAIITLAEPINGVTNWPIGNLPQYYSLNSLDSRYNETATKINYLDHECYVIKIEYGDTAGYHKIPLVYNDDLILKAGEALTSMLDKIKNMLGEYEYFYNVDGKFVFQKKNTYIKELFSPQNGEIIEPTLLISPYEYKFEDTSLFTSISEQPKVSDIKNDFSIWGVRKGISSELPIHARVAIHEKPTKYTTLGWDALNQKWDDVLSKSLTIDDVGDWRELIYLMADDFYKANEQPDFSARLAELNPDLAPLGKTGYEQYYADMHGFWRQLYDPNNPITGVTVENTDLINADNYKDYCVRGCKIENEKTFEALRYQFNIYPVVDQHVYERDEETGEEKEIVKYQIIEWESSAKKTYIEAIQEKIDSLNISVNELNSKWMAYYKDLGVSIVDMNNLIRNYNSAINTFNDVNKSYNDSLSIVFDPANEEEWKKELQRQQDYLILVEKLIMISFIINNNEYYLGITLDGNYPKLPEITLSNDEDMFNDEAIQAFTNILTVLADNLAYFGPIKTKLLSKYQEHNNFTKVKREQKEKMDKIYETLDDNETEENKITDKNAARGYLNALSDCENYVEFKEACLNYQNSEEFKTESETFQNWFTLFVPYIDAYTNVENTEIYSTTYRELSDAYKKFEEVYKACSLLYKDENSRAQKALDILAVAANKESYILSLIEKISKLEQDRVDLETEQENVEGKESFDVSSLKFDSYNNYMLLDDRYQNGYLVLDNFVNLQTEEDKLLLGQNEVTIYQVEHPYDDGTGWNKLVYTDPNSLNFWFDFLDTKGELSKYSVSKIGQRSKVVNENTVNSIYYKEVPEVLFVVQPLETIDSPMAYTPLFIPDNMQELFVRASRGLSAIDRMNELIYNFSFIAESLTINAIPIYYLKPNTRIYIEGYGDYNLNKISYSLTYNGTMNLTSTKIVKQFY